jgi:hypothetical protein
MLKNLNSALSIGLVCILALVPSLSSEPAVSKTLDNRISQLLLEKQHFGTERQFSPHPSSQNFESVCDADKRVPSSWARYQRAALATLDNCARPYRFVEVKVKGSPKTSNLLAPNSTPFCGINPGPNFLNGRAKGNHLDPSYKIHVVGITDSKHSSKSSPEKDYREYFNFLLNGLRSMTDVPSSYSITFSEGYKPMVEDFRQMGLGFKNDSRLDRRKLAETTISSFDSTLDFSKFDKLFVFVPPTVSRDTFMHGGTFNTDFRSAEGSVDGPYFGGRIDDFGHPGWLTHDPLGMLHEMMHIAGGVVEDHYGAWPSGTPQSMQIGPAPGGTGNWGNMSGIYMDFLAWDKYLTQMIGETQLLCAKSDEVGRFWLSPSTHKTTQPKLLLIPTGPNKAIAVESIRASGFNFKVPKKNHGALVYEIDTTKTTHGLGVEVIRPKNRTGPGWTRGGRPWQFAYSDAALKRGEKIEFGSFTVSVIESGLFGDVVQVSPR